jgi:hypothetical protein
MTACRISWLTSSGVIAFQTSMWPSPSLSMPQRLPAPPNQRYWSALPANLESISR